MVNKRCLTYILIIVASVLHQQPALFAARSKKTPSVALSKQQREYQQKTIEEINSVLALASQKGGKSFLDALMHVGSGLVQYLSPEDVLQTLSVIKKITDDQWSMITKHFGALSEEQQHDWVGSFVFAKHDIQKMLNQFPKLIRQKKAAEKLEEDKRKAVGALEKEYSDAIEKHTPVNDFIMSLAGIVQAAANIDDMHMNDHYNYGAQDLDSLINGTDKDSLLKRYRKTEMRFGLNVLSYHRDITYACKNIPKFLYAMTSSRRLTPKEEEIKEAQLEYCMTTLGPKMFNELSKILKAEGLDLFEKNEGKIKKPQNMIRFEDALERMSDRLVDNVFPFLPEASKEPTRLLAKTFLYDLTPALWRHVKMEQKKDANKDWKQILQESTFAEVMKDGVNKHICASFFHSVAATVIHPILNTAHGKLGDMAPFLPLLVSGSTYRDWVDIAQHACMALIPQLRLNVDGQYSSEEKKYIRNAYWRMYKKEGFEKTKEYQLAKNPEEYFKFKIAKTLSVNIVRSGVHAGLLYYKQSLFNGIDRIGSGIAAGTKMILPRPVSKFLINGTSAVKNGLHMVSQLGAPLYVGFKMNNKSSAHMGYLDIKKQVSKDRLTQYLDNKVSTMVGKSIFYWAYNTWFNKGEGAKNYDAKDWAWWLAWWYFYTGAPKSNEDLFEQMMG